MQLNNVSVNVIINVQGKPVVICHITADESVNVICGISFPVYNRFGKRHITETVPLDEVGKPVKTVELAARILRKVCG